MYFGLTTADIVNSFSQTQESDFAVGVISGSEIILNEINFQYEKLLNYLSPEALQQMERINGEVTNVSVSGTFTPSFYALPATLRGYVTDKDYSPCPGQSLEDTSMCWMNYSQQQFIISEASITSQGNNSYLLNDTFDYKRQKLTIYYDVDQTQLTIKSLKTFLRDLVCSSLGARIFPVGNADQWSIVNYYQAEADKFMKFLEEGKLPSEFSKIKLVNKRSPISTIKLVRS